MAPRSASLVSNCKTASVLLNKLVINSSLGWLTLQVANFAASRMDSNRELISSSEGMEILLWSKSGMVKFNCCLTPSWISDSTSEHRRSHRPISFLRRSFWVKASDFRRLRSVTKSRRSTTYWFRLRRLDRTAAWKTRIISFKVPKNALVLLSFEEEVTMIKWRTGFFKKDQCTHYFTDAVFDPLFYSSVKNRQKLWTSGFGMPALQNSQN